MALIRNFGTIDVSPFALLTMNKERYEVIDMIAFNEQAMFYISSSNRIGEKYISDTILKLRMVLHPYYRMYSNCHLIFDIAT